MALPIEIEVWQGEIAELEVDAIVIPANESLFMTTPVAAQVKRYAGDEVEREAVSQGPVAPGGSVVTGGGRLAAPYLIHAVAVGHDLRPDAAQLRSALTSALDAAAHLSLRRIAVAPVGTERGAFAATDAAATLFDVLATHPSVQGRDLESVVIAVTRAEDLQAYRASLEQAAPVPGRGSARLGAETE
jgi:O-acetyl-ADP-ribose deacetylase (regulator of RNase III)